MADLDTVAERLRRALDRIERAVAARPASSDGAQSAASQGEIGRLTHERTRLAEENKALKDRCESLERSNQALKQAGAEISARLDGAIAGLDRLLREDAGNGSRPE